MEAINVFETNASEPDRLTRFLTLAAVLLRCHTRKVLGNLVVTSLADLLPNFTSCGFLSVPFDDEIQFHLKNQGIFSEEKELLIKEALLLSPAFSHHEDEFSETTGTAQVSQLSPELQAELGAPMLYLVCARTPTDRYGWLFGVSDRKLNPEELKFLESLARIVGIGFENAIRFEDMQENAAETNLLNQIAAEMASSLNPEELFIAFLGRLHNILNFEWAGLYLLAGLDKYDLTYHWSNPPGKIRRRLQAEQTLSGSILEQVIKERSSLIDPRDDRPEHEPVFPVGMESRLIIPLLNRGHAFGALAIGSSQLQIYRPDNLPLLLLEKLASVFTPAFINSRRYEEKQYLAAIDERVGTYNHNYFERELPMQVEKARRLSYRLGLLIIDMDNLKTVNDRYNYQIGSAALKQIANTISHCIRKTDMVARYGGDEFTVLLPGCSEEGLAIVSENIRRHVNETPLVLKTGEKLTLSVSIGAALFPADAANPEDLFSRANTALQVAKISHNQVRVGSEARLVDLDDEVLRQGEPERPPLSSEESSTVFTTGLKTDGIITRNDYEGFISWLGADKPTISAQLMSELYQQLREVNQSLDDLNERLAQMERGFRRGLLLSALAVELRESYLEGFAEKTSQLAVALAELAHASNEDIWAVKNAALLANLGRLSVPERILRKTKPLTEREWTIIKTIPTAGAKRAEALGSALKSTTLSAIRFQREQFDGRGYPAGLAGDEIPFLARILGLSGAVVAMSQLRPYRPAFSLEQIRLEIEKGAGRQFDPVLVRMMLNLLENSYL